MITGDMSRILVAGTGTKRAWSWRRSVIWPPRRAAAGPGLGAPGVPGRLGCPALGRLMEPGWRTRPRGGFRHQ